MFAMVMTQRHGLLDGLIAELEATSSSSRRARLIRKLALSHMPEVMDTIAPFLAEEGRVRRAAVEALASFGEDARDPMLTILRDRSRREMQVGALLVLAGIIRRTRG